MNVTERMILFEHAGEIEGGNFGACASAQVRELEEERRRTTFVAIVICVVGSQLSWLVANCLWGFRELPRGHHWAFVCSATSAPR